MVQAEDRKSDIANDIPLELVGPPTAPTLPMVDDDTLDQFLRQPEKVQRLPVKPQEYRREFQRLIVSAFLHTGSGAAA
jgi:hypothetical protein